MNSKQFLNYMTILASTNADDPDTHIAYDYALSLINRRAIEAAEDRADALAAEVEAIQSSAHMPDDYEYGLASWINQYLYAAYIGARMGPTAIQQIETGRLTFPNAPIYQERDRLAAEVERLGAVLKRRNQDYDEVFNDYEEMRAAWEAGAEVQAERDALRGQLRQWLFPAELLAALDIDSGDDGVSPDSVVAAIKALRAQLDAGEGWRPVSEAPEKKGYYLGWRGDRVVWAGYWPGEYYPDSSPWVDEVGLDIAITHWRPLPAPPQE